MMKIITFTFQQCGGENYQECFQPSCRNISRPNFTKTCEEIIDEECEVIIEQTMEQQCKEVVDRDYEEQCEVVGTEEECSTVQEYTCTNQQVASPLDHIPQNTYNSQQVSTHIVYN